MKLCPKCNNLFPDDIQECLIDGTPLVVSEDPLVGKLIGGCYRIVRQIASGGMGNVYAARHEYLSREVAVKVLKPLLGKEDEYRQRIIREARICATVDHIHIVKAFDLVMSDGLVCLVMEMLSGETLKSRLKRLGPLGVGAVLRILSMTAEALASAHSLDIVHRDIKPSNIYLARYMGADDFVKLLDFGIAFALKESRLTRQGAALGTPPYMAPELFNASEPSKASDIYSLACVTYQALSGRTPFHNQDMSEIVQGHLNREPEPIRSHNPDVPEKLEEILAKMLVKDPQQRYHDAFQLLHALQTSGLYNQEYEERPSYTAPEEETEEISLRSEWGDYFQEVDEGDHTSSQSVQTGLQAVTELGRIEKQKKQMVHRMERLEGQRRSTQRNIANALRTLHADLSRMREDRERDQMEYLKIRTEKDFLQDEVLRTEETLFQVLEKRVQDPDRKLTPEALESLARAASTVQRYLDVRHRTGEIRDARRSYPDTVRDMKFQIDELQGRIKAVEEETEAEREKYRKELESLSEEGERYRQEAARAAVEVQAAKG